MKVMLSLPPEAVAQLDDLAHAQGTTRSELVRRLAEDAAVLERARRSERLKELLSDPASRGGGATEFVRAARHRDDG
jgi:metal-responsive CopG/Arc/MetJ family transcriptional regulator